MIVKLNCSNTEMDTLVRGKRKFDVGSPDMIRFMKTTPSHCWPVIHTDKVALSKPADTEGLSVEAFVVPVKEIVPFLTVGTTEYNLASYIAVEANELFEFSKSVLTTPPEKTDDMDALCGFAYIRALEEAAKLTKEKLVELLAQTFAEMTHVINRNQDLEKRLAMIELRAALLRH